jgi:prepilin-type N-terminal cleavage/methylation domain-containing protein
MRRGATLIEMMTAMAVTALLLTVVLRLVFFSDRALGAQENRGRSVAAAARLMADMSTDLRGATSASGGEGRLSIGGPQDVTYTWSAGQHAAVRHISGLPGEDRVYPGTMFHANATGGLMTLALRNGKTSLTTAVRMRG